MNDLLHDTLNEVCDKTSQLVHRSNRQTMNASMIVSAIRLLLKKDICEDLEIQIQNRLKEYMNHENSE